ncbi:MAG: alpha/beta fold hydrolase [Burkholderiales bacterium]|nr:alpha/beta fold hydrolase [Burkholderiales bacterium]
MAVETALMLNTADGHVLAATHFAPAGNARGMVLLVPAMGADQRYYAPLARWLAAQGWQVLTFDYRGMGTSRQGGLRGFAADISTWATQDCATLLAEAHRRAAGTPVLWVGHSLGGQVAGLVPNLHLARRVVNIASGSGYWRDNAPQLKRRVLLLWYGVMPLATALCGYFPGKRLRMVGDLPLGVIRQWRRWCLHPKYLIGVEGEAARARYAGISQPITSISFTDDELVSERSIAVLHEFYSAAPRQMRRYSPADLGLRRIGHFGFFKPDGAEALWPLLLPELAALEQTDLPIAAITD